MDAHKEKKLTSSFNKNSVRTIKNQFTYLHNEAIYAEYKIASNVDFYT
jgi:hypothetical protein